MLIHGDADMLVPIRQSKRIMGKFKQEGVEAELLTMPGKNHGWKAKPEGSNVLGIGSISIYCEGNKS